MSRPSTGWWMDDTGKLLGYWTRGHLTLDDVRKAVANEYGEEDAHSIADGKLKHTYGREVSTFETDYKEAFGQRMLIESKQGRGAFPMTLVLCPAKRTMTFSEMKARTLEEMHTRCFADFDCLVDWVYHHFDDLDEREATDVANAAADAYEKDLRWQVADYYYDRRRGT
jgi:hypothetical protein